MDYFKRFRDEYSFSSVKRLVESSKSHLDEVFDIGESDLSGAESSILADLSWDELERENGRSEWVSFSYDDSTVKVFVYASYSSDGGELEYTNVRFVLRDCGETCQFQVLPNGTITEE